MTASAPPPATPERPLAISLLLGASGWVAGLFLLAFVAALFRPDDAGQAARSGAVLLAAAWGLFKVGRDGAQVFVGQLALALSIAGQCLMVFAMSKHARGIAPIAHAALALQVALVLVMPDRTSRFLSTLFATIAWALTLRFALFDDPDGVLQRVAPSAPSLPATLGGWLLTWLPVAGVLWWAVRHAAGWATRPWAPAARPVVTGLIAGLAFATLASQPFEPGSWIVGNAGGPGSLALWPLLSALGALGALAAAFAWRRPGLMAACAVAALLHVGHFYLALGTTLLVKSLLMLAMGGAFLAAARLLRVKGDS